MLMDQVVRGEGVVRDNGIRGVCRLKVSLLQFGSTEDRRGVLEILQKVSSLSGDTVAETPLLFEGF